MYSLNNYKEQCYNLGSPQPSPSRPPLQTLPKATNQSDLTDSFVFPKITSKIPTKEKINTRERKSKRKVEETEFVPPMSPPKKQKMMKEEELRTFLTGITNRMDDFSKQLASHSVQSSKHEENLTNLSNSFTTFKESFHNSNRNLEEKMSGLENEMGNLKDTVENSVTRTIEEVKNAIVPFIQDEIVPTLTAKITSDILKKVDAPWKLQLAEQNRDNDSRAIVFGLPVKSSPMEDAIDFLKTKLNMKEESLNKIYLKQANRLGKAKGDRPPPLLMHFSHPSDRILVFSHSKNIKDRKISLEKQVPKLYQDEHKKFKNLATKLRNLPEMNYQTDICFDGHLMLLRYKKRDTPTQKYHYVTHSEWYPPMVKASSELRSTIHIPAGTVATPVISPETTSKANCCFFMTGMSTERTEDTFRRLLLEHINPEDRDSVTEIKLQKSHTGIIYCRSWDECNKIVLSKKDSKFHDDKVYLSMFAEKKPENA